MPALLFALLIFALLCLAFTGLVCAIVKRAQTGCETAESGFHTCDTCPYAGSCKSAGVGR